MQWKTITSLSEFQETVENWKGVVACDTETKGKAWNPAERKLLGLSLASESHPDLGLYIPFYSNDNLILKDCVDQRLLAYVRQWLAEQQLVGHNFTYDKRWLELHEFRTNWVADTRLMWHMASAPAGPRGYSLKDAQVDLLGWDAKNDKELSDNVKSRGGSLRNGDHWMADDAIMAKYAAFDAVATIQVYLKLKGFFDMHEYWDFLGSVMEYNELIEGNTYHGVPVDEKGLQKALEKAQNACERHEKELRKVLGPQIQEIEDAWLEAKILSYKPGKHKAHHVKRLMSRPDKWPKFNWNSPDHKAELFYTKLGNPVVYRTETGKPATDKDSIKAMQGEWREPYLKYNHYSHLITSFIQPWLDSAENGRLHPGFNITGTVSYRLSGFKPYFLNLPFDENFMMKNFTCPPGYVGVHSDLVSIEPTITAHYSEDPHMLKVFRDGLGDIYLDLALELFPDNKELKDVYNPNLPISSEVKERLEKPRKIAKVIQLAVQYTGTGHTVAKNLTKGGIATDVATADGYVRAYWRKFRKVAEFEYRLRELNRSQGVLRNVVGRVVRVPDPDYKDLMNRFVQSSAHDCLMLWVLKISRMAKERKLDMSPLLVDCHDSTSWAVRENQKAEAKQVFEDALLELNQELGLAVTIRADTKYFKTFAGLKRDE
jgi:DNA polymerase I-like protein with 3'-5' exonuclease and polymerase domains